MPDFQVPKGKMSSWLCYLEHVNRDKVTNDMKSLINNVLWYALLFQKCCFLLTYFLLCDFIHLENNLRRLMLEIYLIRHKEKKKIPMQEKLWLSTEKYNEHNQEKGLLKICPILVSFSKTYQILQKLHQKVLQLYPDLWKT